MTTFNVEIHVFETEEEGVLHINVNPEMITLQGVAGDTILWTIRTPSTAFFVNHSGSQDVDFKTLGGKALFDVVFISPSQILATVRDGNENQTIYTYYLTVHLVNPAGVAIRIDPEVDNPPPPPGP